MKCDEIIILYKNNQGNIETTEKDIQKIVDMAYTKGFEAGKQMNFYSCNTILNSLPDYQLTTCSTDSSCADRVYSTSPMAEDTCLL